jgi:hypothetical protein
VFCRTDDFLTDYLADTGRLNRGRGPKPTVPDSVVLTCELVGQFLSYDTDSGIFRYFRRHHDRLFPNLLKIDRTSVPNNEIYRLTYILANIDVVVFHSRSASLFTRSRMYQ